MFIELVGRRDFSLQWSDMNGSSFSFALHCAPLERETLVGREVYKHLAPMEPEAMFT